MKYNNYTARIEYDPDDDIFVGHIAGIRDIVGFHADNVEELKIAFYESVDDYIETCAKEPQKPFSGKVMFRIDPETHRQAALAAELAGVSFNQWAEQLSKKQPRHD